jgi:hypothetical protein
MDSILGTYREGHIIPDEPVNWPEGARVVISPAAEEVGLNEATWPDTPEARAELLARMNAAEPVEMTSEEEAEIEAAREAVKKVTLEAVRRKMGLAP